MKLVSTFILITAFLSQSAIAQYCSGTIVKNTSSGSFTDGSGSNNYADNSDCLWLIAPPGAASITLSFTGVFDLEVYNCSDKITVYDGGDTTANVLAVLCGNNSMTPPAPVTSTGGTMLVRFTSDYSYSNGGWNASYTTIAAPPVYCSGQSSLTSASGSFSDGSGNSNNYGDNASCSWLIEPAGAISITLTFNSFATEAGMDFVKVYDNSTSPATQMGSYSGNSLPSAITVNSGSMLVEFTSNTTTTATGWDASYTSTQPPPPPPVACSGTTTLTAPMGTFDDGSGSTANYSDNADCSWVINPANMASITLTFSAFDTQSGQDLVQVYDNSTSPATILGAFSGSTIPSPITLTGNNMLVTFTSNASTNAAGWAASYTSSNTSSGIADLSSGKTVSIYPNPFHHTATLSFSTVPNEICELIMYDIYGKTVKKIQIPAYTSSLIIDGSTLANGIYYYRLNESNSNVHTGKLILE
jgi:hypothetical protein